MVRMGVHGANSGGVFGRVKDQASLDVLLAIRTRDPMRDPNAGDKLITIEITEE